MTINKINNGGTMIINISGRIDTMTSPILEQELRNSCEKYEAVTLDFSEVEYISSAGLRVLLSAHKTMSKKNGMKLKNVGADIMEIFEVTGFSDILDIG